MAVLLPLLWIALASIKTRADSLSRPPVLLFTPTGENYRSAFEKRNLAQPVVNSLVVGTLSSLISMLLAGPLGFLIARGQVRFSYQIFFSLLTTRMAPPVAIALPLYWLLGSIGLLDTFLGLISVHVAANFAVAVWLLRVVFDGVSDSIVDAGMLDGLTMVGAARKLVLPAVAPSLVAVFLVLFALSWGEMLLSSLVGSFDRRPLSVAVLELVTPHGTFWGVVAALATISVFPVALLALVATQIASRRGH